MYTGLTASFLHLSLFKNIVTFLCWFCFFSVQHFAARKQGVHISPKVILLISATGAMAEPALCPDAFHIPLPHAVYKGIAFTGNQTQLKIPVVRTNKMRSSTTLKKKKNNNLFPPSLSVFIIVIQTEEIITLSIIE